MGDGVQGGHPFLDGLGAAPRRWITGPLVCLRYLPAESPPPAPFSEDMPRKGGQNTLLLARSPASGVPPWDRAQGRTSTHPGGPPDQPGRAPKRAPSLPSEESERAGRRRIGERGNLRNGYRPRPARFASPLPYLCSHSIRVAHPGRTSTPPGENGAAQGRLRPWIDRGGDSPQGL